MESRTEWTTQASARISAAFESAKLHEKLSLNRLARETGIAAGTLDRRLNGDLRWTLAEVEAVAKALGLDPLDLIDPARPRVKVAS